MGSITGAQPRLLFLFAYRSRPWGQALQSPGGGGLSAPPPLSSAMPSPLWRSPSTCSLPLSRPPPAEFKSRPIAGLPCPPLGIIRMSSQGAASRQGTPLMPPTKHGRVPFASIPRLYSLRRHEGPCNASVEAAQCPAYPLAMLCPSSPFPSLFPPRSRPWPPPSRRASGFCNARLAWGGPCIAGCPCHSGGSLLAMYSPSPQAPLPFSFLTHCSPTRPCSLAIGLARGQSPSLCPSGSLRVPPPSALRTDLLPA